MIVEKEKGGVISQISFPIESILKIQNIIVRKDPSLGILPKYNAQGNKHQWVLPTGANDVWMRLGSAHPEIREQVMRKINEAKNAFSSQQKGASPKQIDAIFNSPNNDEFVFYRTDFDGTVTGVAIAAWGFRYPDNSQKKGVVMEDELSNIQKVQIKMTNDGKPGENREFKYGLVTNSKTKTGLTNKEGTCSIGNFAVGLEFFVFDTQTAKNFTFTVRKGQERYECDVTVEKPIIEPEKTVVEPEKPVVEPEKPVVEPEKPVVEPEKPVVEPEKPVVEPENPVVEPEKPEIPPQIPFKKEISPKLQVVDKEGATVPNFPVFINCSGKKDRLFSDKGGYIQLPRMKEEDKFSVSDGFSDTNKEEFTVNADIDTYIYHLDYALKTGNKDISIHVIDEKEKEICKDYVVLKLDRRVLQCTLDDKGYIYLDNNDFERNKAIKFVLVQDGREYTTENFMLVPGEQEYTVQLDTLPCPWWKRMVEILVAVASIAVILYVFGLIVVICDSIA